MAEFVQLAKDFVLGQYKVASLLIFAPTLSKTRALEKLEADEGTDALDIFDPATDCDLWDGESRIGADPKIAEG